MSPEHGHHSHRRRHSSRRKHQHLPVAVSRRLSRPTPFEFFRIAAYAFVLLWSLVAVVISVHFETIFQASDLTRFVPYALFTSAASMLASLCLGAMVLLFRSGSFATKVESATCGLIGVFWIGLSGLTATSPAEEAEVECFFDPDDTEINNSSSFTTEVYQAQYRVLVAAGFINAFLLLGICVTLLYINYRYYRTTKNWVEYTGQPLINKGGKDREKSRSSSRSTAPLTPVPPRVAKRETTSTKDRLKGLPLPAVAKRSKSEQQPPSRPPVPASKPKTTPAAKATPTLHTTKPTGTSSQPIKAKTAVTTSKTPNKPTASTQPKGSPSGPPRATTGQRATTTRTTATPSTQRPTRQGTTAPIYTQFKR